MPAPTNISFVTATDLGTLPADVTQTVDFGGTTYSVYYKFTAPADATVIGAFGFGDLVTYKPTIQPYDHTQTGILSMSAQNKAIQFPVTGGLLYYLFFLTNGGNPSPAVLTLNVQVAPDQPAASPGAFGVNDDTVGHPLGFASGGADNTMLKFVDGIVSGESGDSLDDGTLLLEDEDNGTAVLYANDFSIIATITPSVGTVAERAAIRTCTPSQRFYLGTTHNPPSFMTVDRDGTLGTFTQLTGSTGLGSLAASNTEAILYHATSLNSAVVERWDITGGAALSNLAAAVGTSKVIDIIVLADDTILVGHEDAGTFSALRYDAAGTLLNTYTFGAFGAASPPRMNTAIDNPTSFWVMQAQSSNETTHFQNVRVSDGTILTTRIQTLYAAGVYSGAVTATPLARFGTSPSCPFWVVRGTTTTNVFTIRRQRRFLLPSSDDNKRVKIPVLELLQQGGVGLTPAAWNSAANLPQGANPQVMMRISKDGGKTWGPERWRSAGLIGKFLERVRWLQATGAYRNAVCEITVTDPVDWQVIGMMGTPEEGSS